MEPLHTNSWDDFEVAHTKSNASDARSYYESYLTFRKLLDELPKPELLRRGWMSSEDDLSSMVPLFQDVHSHKEDALFRKSDTSNVALCAAWKSRVSIVAKILVANLDIDEFSGVDTGYLKDLAKLSVDVSCIVSLPAILAEKGIVLIYEKALPGMKLDGVVFTLDSGHPVVGISFRFPRLDNFWFTLMHELAHIYLHIDILDAPIFDDLEIDNKEVAEQKANRLAKYSFVEKHLWRNCAGKYDRGDETVIEFSKKIGIHPAIVAGMLQKELGKFDRFRKIVDEVDVRRELFGDD